MEALFPEIHKNCILQWFILIFQVLFASINRLDFFHRGLKVRIFVFGGFPKVETCRSFWCIRSLTVRNIQNFYYRWFISLLKIILLVVYKFTVLHRGFSWKKIMTNHFCKKNCGFLSCASKPIITKGAVHNVLFRILKLFYLRDYRLDFFLQALNRKLSTVKREFKQTDWFCSLGENLANRKYPKVLLFLIYLGVQTHLLP